MPQIVAHGRLSDMFNPLIDSQVERALSMALRQAQDKSEEIFRDRRRMCLDFYMDRVLKEDNGSDSYIKEAFGVLDENENLEYPSFLGLEHVPMTRKIVNKKAKVYKVQPIRKVKGEEAEGYSDLLYRSRFPSISKKIDQLTYLLNDTCVGLFVDPDMNDRVRFRLYNDFVPLFGPDDPFNPKAVVVLTGWEAKGGKEVWAYYDEEKRILVDREGNRVEVEGVESEQEHNYGTLPFIFPHYDEPVEHFFSTPRVGLVQANQAVDIAKTALNQLIKYNGFKQLVIIGDTGDTASKFILGKSRALTITPGNAPEQFQPSAQTLDMQANFTEHVEALKFSMELAAHNANVNIRWRMEGGPQSGVALKIQDLDDIEDRQQAIEVYQAYIEDAMYEKLLKYQEAKVLSGKIEKGTIDEFHADFAEVGYEETVDETASREKHELEIGVTNPLDLIKARNPDLDDEEAAAQYLRNRKLNGLGGKKELTLDGILEALQPSDKEINEVIGE